MEINLKEKSETMTEEVVTMLIPSIPEEIYEALFGCTKGTITNIEKGINPGFTILKK